MEEKAYASQDDTVSGAAFVYCCQHLRVHNTGWCGVSNLDKIPLISRTMDEAQEEWRRKASVIHMLCKPRTKGDR